QDPTNWSYVGSWVGAFATDLKPKGSGIPTDMFKIGTPEALAWFSNYVNDTPTSAAAGKEDAVLTADIDLLGKQFTGKTSAGANYVDTLSWSSIGIRGTNTYKGTFDGDGHAVKNMRTGMISNGDAAAGFVNYAQDSAFKDLAVDGRVTAYVSKAGTHAQAGLIAGDTKGSSFTGCSTSGEVYADGQTAGVAYAGGIVGGLEGGSVTDCSSTASVTSTTSSKDISAAGGLVGRIASGGSAVSIERCAYRGTVQDTASGGAAGGLLGLSHDTTDVKMQDCSAAGTVSAELFVGGIAGYAGGKFTLSNSYSRASVTGTDGLTWVSGLLGFASGSYVEDSLISRCFWLKGATSLDAEAAGNIDTRDVAELSDVQLKGRGRGRGAPTAGLGGTNGGRAEHDGLRRRTGSAAVWIVAPDKRNDGYPTSRLPAWWKPARPRWPPRAWPPRRGRRTWARLGCPHENELPSAAAVTAAATNR
ncbi:MAG: GLUG motif-containing protein, partial [Eggerthellaceae bacterium]